MISRCEQHFDCTFVIVSDTGISHRIKQIPNQDAVNYFIDGEDFALAVSDGVGSCLNASFGSSSAIDAVEDVFFDLKKTESVLNSHEIAEQIIRKWKKRLDDENPDDCCATLKAAIKIGNKVFLLSIGDGILALTSGGQKICAPIESNLFANQTICLAGTVDAADFWTADFILDTYVPYVIFACSDGVANGIQEGREMELVSEIETDTTVEELQSELESLLVDLSEYSSDDRTVGVVKYERKNAKPDR